MVVFWVGCYYTSQQTSALDGNNTFKNRASTPNDPVLVLIAGAFCILNVFLRCRAKAKPKFRNSQIISTVVGHDSVFAHWCLSQKLES